MDCQSEYEKHLKIAEQCAPVVADVKSSNLLLLEGVTTAEVEELVRDTGVSVCYLYSGRKKNAWLLYQRSRMEEILSDRENRGFLQSCGYRQFSLEDVLAGLRDRAQKYLSGQGEYPHELGLLLGYPLGDVRGFIEYQGKNFLCSGFWKVYSDEDHARRTFALYRKVRHEAVTRVKGMQRPANYEKGGLKS